jgi:membrane protein
VADGGTKLGRARARVDAGIERFGGSIAGEVWRRLSAVDFINQGLLLGGTLIAWTVPSLMLLDAIRGTSVVANVSSRMGLNSEAAGRVAELFKEPSHATAITVGAVGVVAFGLYSAAAVVERIYELVFELEGRGLRDMWRRAVWPVVTVAGISATRWIDLQLNGIPAGPVLAALASFGLITLFFWWSMHFLLGGRLGWRSLLPASVFSTAGWVGLGVFSRFTLSRAVIANDDEYGHIGIVFILMTYLLAVGVVLILGPVLGAAWTTVVEERRARRARAGAQATTPS